MASSKKTGPSSSKSAKNKAEESKIEDAVIVGEETPKPKTTAKTDAKPKAAGASKAGTNTGASSAAKKPAVSADKPKKPDTPKAEAAKTSATASKAATPKQDDKKPEDKTAQSGTAQTKPQEVKPDAAISASNAQTTSQTRSTPAQSSSASTTAPAPAKKSIFLPLVLGGVVAGVIGFMASEIGVFDGEAIDPTTDLRSELTAQQERIDALENAEAPAVQETDLSGIESQLGEVEATIATLEDRLVALEERPVSTSTNEGGEAVDTAAAEAFAAELEELKASAEAQRTEIAALLENTKQAEEAAAAASQAASAQSAIAKIVSAIDAGQPFEEAVSTLTELDIGEIDPALTSNAADGVATLNALQNDFPDQARTALATARASGVEDGQQGIGGFLKRSLGARSVAPREGDDPDAVLSRAEAALQSGDLSTTLNELDTLPEEAQAAISDWRAAADARVAARNAADALAQRLTAD